MLVEKGQVADVLIGNPEALGQVADELFHTLSGDLIQAAFQLIPVGGVIDVGNGPAVFQSETGAGHKTFPPGGQVFAEHRFRYGGKGGPQQVVNILVVVIEGVPADAAVGNDVLHGDLIQWIQIKELYKRVHNGLLGFWSGQKKPPFLQSTQNAFGYYSTSAQKKQGDSGGRNGKGALHPIAQRIRKLSFHAGMTVSLLRSSSLKASAAQLIWFS